MRRSSPCTVTQQVSDRTGNQGSCHKPDAVCTRGYQERGGGQTALVATSDQYHLILSHSLGHSSDAKWGRSVTEIGEVEAKRAIILPP